MTKSIDIQPEHSKQQDLEIWESNKIVYLSTGISNSKFGSSLCVGNFLGEETLVISAPYEDVEGAIYMVPLNDLLERTNSKDRNFFVKVQTTRKSTKTTKDLITFPSLFGMDVYVWKIDNLQILVVSEPGKSSFSFLIEDKIVAILKSTLPDTILGHNGYKEWKLLGKDFHDINNDGFPDLIIGSMYSDDFSFSQRGIVKVLNGKLIYERLIQFITIPKTLEILELDMSEFVLVNYTIPKQFVRNSSYEHFGSSFATTKLYSFIGIGFHDAVLIFEKETGIFKDFVSRTNSDQNLTSLKGKSLFGFNKILDGIYNDIEWIMISAVGFSCGIDYPLSGAVYFYVIQNGKVILKAIITPPQQKKTSTDNVAFSLFGASMLKIGDDKVIISGEGYLDGRGGLFIVNLHSLIKLSVKKKITVAADLIYVGDEGTGLMSLGTNSLDLAVIKNRVYVVAGLPDFLFSGIPNALTSTGAVSLIRLT